MKKKAFFCCFALVLLFSGNTYAERQPRLSQNGFELLFVNAIGTNLREPELFSGLIALRARFLERTPFAAEVSFVAPFGIGANLLIYAYHDRWISVHLLDVGIYYSWLRYFTAPYIPRDFDVTLGAGVEVSILPWMRVTLDWRLFFADPVNVAPNYGDWAIKAYRESAAGGELWLGVAFVL